MVAKSRIIAKLAIIFSHNAEEAMKINNEWWNEDVEI